MNKYSQERGKCAKTLKRAKLRSGQSHSLNRDFLDQQVQCLAIQLSRLYQEKTDVVKNGSEALCANLMLSKSEYQV